MVLLSAIGSNVLFAKEKGAVITNATLRKEQGNIRVSFDMQIDKLRSDYMLVVTPRLVAGTRSVIMEPRVVAGRRKQIMEERAGNDKDSYIRASKRHGSYHYSAVIPYEEWMHDVTLNIRQEMEGCCDREELASTDVLTRMLMPHAITPHYEREPAQVPPVENRAKELEQFLFVHPKSTYASRYDMLHMENRSANNTTIFFKQSGTGIDPSFRDNYAVLQRVVKALEIIEKNPDLTLDKIMIAGFSSPEGTLEINTRISESRMNTLRDYLVKRKNYGSDIFELHNGKEDWDGLRYFVEKSDMKYREEVLRIIRDVPVLNGREKQLMDLAGGEPYRYMLTHFFPELRNAGYIQVYYDETATANAAVTEENAKLDILNKAVDKINCKEYFAAISLLDRVDNDPRALNLKGVCLMMQQKYDEAEALFKKAMATGDHFAAENMRELEKARQAN